MIEILGGKNGEWNSISLFLASCQSFSKFSSLKNYFTIMFIGKSHKPGYQFSKQETIEFEDYLDLCKIESLFGCFSTNTRLLTRKRFSKHKFPSICPSHAPSNIKMGN